MIQEEPRVIGLLYQWVKSLGKQELLKLKRLCEDIINKENNAGEIEIMLGLQDLLRLNLLV